MVAHFQRMVCRFIKRVSVENYNKLEANLDNYIGIFCTYNVHFYDWFSDICSRCSSFVVPWKLSSEIYTCLGSNNRKCRNVAMTCGRYIRRRNMSGKCSFLPLVSNSHIKYDFRLLVVPFTSTQNIRHFAQSPFKNRYLRDHAEKECFKVVLMREEPHVFIFFCYCC